MSYNGTATAPGALDAYKIYLDTMKAKAKEKEEEKRRLTLATYTKPMKSAYVDDDDAYATYWAAVAVEKADKAAYIDDDDAYATYWAAVAENKTKG